MIILLFTGLMHHQHWNMRYLSGIQPPGKSQPLVMTADPVGRHERFTLLAPQGTPTYVVLAVQQCFIPVRFEVGRMAFATVIQ